MSNQRLNRRSPQYIVHNMGRLYVIGTPIGNLEDMTLRAARILGEVSLVAAEDTRVTRKLLNHLDVKVPCVSCNEHNWRRRLPQLMRALASEDVALVTDAGMPGVSDPGSAVVSALAEEGIDVQVIPGPSAVTTALAASGLPADSFLFLGFLPRRGRERRDRLAGAAVVPDTLVIFESPHRLRPTLAELLDTLGDRPVAICRELTKLHEEVWRGRLSGATQFFPEPRGELVLVVAGASPVDRLEDPARQEQAREQAREQLTALRRTGVHAREAVAEVMAATGLPRSEVYRLWVETGRS